MEAVEDIVDDRLSHFLEDLFLCAVDVEYLIEHERDALGLVVILEDQLGALADSMKDRWVSSQFFGIERSKTAEDFDVPLALHYYYKAKRNKNLVLS